MKIGPPPLTTTNSKLERVHKVIPTISSTYTLFHMWLDFSVYKKITKYNGHTFI